MAARWRWPALLAGLLLIGLGLAWLDATWFRPSLPFDLGLGIGPRARWAAFRGPAPLEPGLRNPTFQFIPGSQLFGFWVLASNGLVFMLLALGMLALFPSRIRLAVERLEAPLGPAVAFAAGFATLLIILGGSFLLRFSVIFPALLPVLWVTGALAAAFGTAAVSLAVGRLLRRPLGEGAPLALGLAGVLVIFDLGLLPLAGTFLLALFVLAGLGLAIVSRFGSARGWSLEELRW